MSIKDVLQEMAQRHAGGYERVHRVLSDRVREYWQQQGQPVLIVPLSGGIDSTVTLALVCQAVGTENVYPMTLPAREGDPSVHAAQLVREWLQFPSTGQHGPYEVDISPLMQAAQHVGIGAGDQMRMGNFGSRLRIAITYDAAHRLGGRVVGCGNLTEYRQGYATKWGTPTSCDLAPIQHLYKLDVRKIAKLLGVPPEIQASEPTTGFYEGQTHALELGCSIEQQDALAYLLFEKKLTAQQCEERHGIPASLGDAMLARWHRSAHKRDSPRAFNWS